MFLIAIVHSDDLIQGFVCAAGQRDVDASVAPRLESEKMRACTQFFFSGNGSRPASVVIVDRKESKHTKSRGRR